MRDKPRPRPAGARAGRALRDRSVGPVFALTGLPRSSKGAFFARYSRSPKSLRRLRRRVPARRAGAQGAAPPSARRAPRPLRPGAGRVRRRLRRPARRRPHRRGGGLQHPHQGPPVGAPRELPGAVDALHRLHRPPRRGTATTAPRRSWPTWSSARDLRRRWTAPSTAYPTCCPAWSPTSGPRCPTTWRPRRRPRARGPGARARPAAGPSPGGDHGERRDLRSGAGLRGHAGADGGPPPARGPRVRCVSACSPSQEGDPRGLPHALSTGRTAESPTGATCGRRSWPRPRSRRASRPSPPGSCPARACGWSILDPDGEARVLAHALWPAGGAALREARARAAEPRPGHSCPASRRLGKDRADRRQRPGSGPRGDDLRVRGRVRLRRLPRPAAPPDAHPPGTAADAAARIRRPPEVADAGAGDVYDAVQAARAQLHDALAEVVPDEAAYAVTLAHRIRFTMVLDAREAIHLIELRSQPQGHESYRWSPARCTQIAEVALTAPSLR